MDWTKIKTKHFLFSKMSDREQAGLVRLLCLTAHLEKLPDAEEMRQVCGQKTLESLSNHYQSEDQSLSNVLQKVLEDVAKLTKKRDRDRDYHKTYDKSRQRDQFPNSSCREEKIREDKRRTNNIYTPLFEDLWKQYPSKDGKKRALASFGASVRNDGDAEQIKVALKNYLSSERVKGGYVKNGATWFGNWQDWVEWKEPTKEKSEAERYKEFMEGK